MFEIPAWLLSWFYGITHNYAASIALIAVVVMLIITPLTLKSTKGMLEMQRLAPEMRKLQQLHRNDRQKLNEEMMKLYQEHKVNPMASCLPLVAQMPVFIIMFRILHGLTYKPQGAASPVINGIFVAAGQQPPPQLGFVPRYISQSSELYESLTNSGHFDKTDMMSLGLDLAKSPAQALGESLATGMIYALLVVGLAGLYFLQQRMVAARAAVSPTMSPGQQKLMQYLPVVFAIFQVFFLTGLIIYYAAQAVLRIAQQAYITRRFYGHEESLGRQAQRASTTAREIANADKDGGGGFFAQMRGEVASKSADPPSSNGKPVSKSGGSSASNGSKAKGSPAAAKPNAPKQATKRTTAPKGRPTPSGGASGNAAAKQKPTPPAGRPGGSRSKSGGKPRS
ncbi:MAG: membrane protein insertase YidC [Ilumatobacteraceae bacterium]